MSKELEYLEEIKSYFPFVDLGKGKEYVCEKEFNAIKQALIKAEKEHKALEIIKKKNVSVCGFRNRVFGYHSNMTINDTYEYYLNYFGCYHNGFDVELLTQEEFNLLKEVLECLNDY